MNRRRYIYISMGNFSNDMVIVAGLGARLL